MIDKHTPERAQKRAARLKAEGHPVEFKHDWRYFCGTLYEMPIDTPIATVLKDADRAIEFAQSARKAHARKSKKGSKRRERDIQEALDRLKKAMRPVRHNISRLPYLPNATEAKPLRKASAAMQRERRKLWKMQQKGKDAKD